MGKAYVFLGLFVVLGLIGIANATPGIGGWNTTTDAPFVPFICTNYTSTLYCYDGSNWNSAQLSSTGISSWTTLGSSLPPDFSLPNCDGSTVYDGYYYCLGENSDNNPIAYYTPISESSIGSTWTQTNGPPTFAGANGNGAYVCVFYSAGGSEYVYCMSLNNPNNDNAYYAEVNPSGGIGGWNATTPVSPTPTPSLGVIFQVLGSNTLYYGSSGSSAVSFVNLTQSGNTGSGGSTTSFPSQTTGCSYYNPYGFLYCQDGNTEYDAQVLSPVGIASFSTTNPFPSGVAPSIYGNSGYTPHQYWGFIINGYIYDIGAGDGNGYYAKVFGLTYGPQLFAPPSITYGQGITVTAVANPTTDSITLTFGGMTTNGIGSVSITIPTNSIILAGGTANALACDTTNGLCTTQTVIVNKATPSISLTVPSNYTYNGVGGTITWSIGELGGNTITNQGQLSSTLYINGNPVVTTNNIVSQYTTSAAPGTYNAYVTTSSNQNYTAATSSTESFTITPTPVVSISPSFQTEDVGQGISITSNIINYGAGKITYQWYNGTNTIIGANGPTYTANAVDTGSFSYSLVITDQYGGIGVSNNAVVTVYPTPLVQAVPASEGRDIGQTITVSSNIINPGSGITSYQWYNGTNVINGARGPIYTAVAGTLGTFNYSVIVTDSNGGKGLSNNAIVTVSNIPAVKAYPTNQIVDSGQAIEISSNIINSGSGITGYQWYNGTNPVSGQKSPSYTSMANAIGTFNYYVVVTDSNLGTNSSNYAIVTVNPALVISITPNPAHLDISQNVLLTASVSGGTGPYSYKWEVNGNVVGGNSNTYTFQGNASTLAGSVDSVIVIVTDSATVPASQTGSDAVTVYATPTVRISPISQSEDIGQTITIFSTVTNPGSGGDTYQWYNATSGNPIPGQTGSSYTATAKAVGTFSYYVIVTDSDGTTGSSNMASVTVSSSPSAVTISPPTQSRDVGQTITITSNVVNQGSGSITYQWYNGTSGNPIPGQTGPSYTAIAGATGTFDYYLVITDSNGGSAQSNNAVVVVTPTPVVSVSPQSQTEDVGQKITITSTIINPGSGITGYQWYNGTTPIPGQTGPSYTATANALGTFYYHVVVTDSNLGTGSSGNAQVIVNPALSVSITPNPAHLDVGQNVLLTASVSGGTGPYSYEWEVNGNVVGGNSNTYTFQGNASTLAGSVDSVKVIVTDSATVPASQTGSDAVTVYPTPTVKISIMCSSNSIYVGQTITITSTVTNPGSGGITYQWYNGTSPIPGQTGSTYTVQANAIGTFYYYLVVTDSDGGKGQSNTEAITVTAVPPSISLCSSSVVYGTACAISATATPDQDTLNLKIGTLPLVSGTGTVNSNLPATGYTSSYVAAGSANVLSCDTINSECSSKILTVTKATPVITLTVPSNYTYNGLGGAIEWTVGQIGVNSIKGQLSSTLYVNGNAVYTSSNIDSTYITSNAIGNYLVYVTTAGNQNYTSATTNTQRFSILQPPPSCTGNNDGKPVSVTGSSITETIVIKNQSGVGITGSSNNITVVMVGSNCNIALSVTGSSNKVFVNNGTITLTDTGSSNIIKLHNTVISTQTVTGSSDQVINGIIDGNSFTVTGSSNLIETFQIEALNSMTITGSGSDITMTMLTDQPVSTTITGSSNLLYLVNGVVSTLTITGSSNNVYTHDTTIENQKITGSDNQILKD